MGRLLHLDPQRFLPSDPHVRAIAVRLFTALAGSGWKGRIITTFRPDDVVDPDRTDFIANVLRLGELTREMQLHAGAWRNHNGSLFSGFGRDKGGDFPTQTNFTAALKPLLDRFGWRRDFLLILFTLDESTYSRELAPLAGHYPCLKLGPPWWFHDAPEAMLRFRRQSTESAGFYNTVGFNDDTRAFFSIPARHDLARRIDCAYRL